MRVAVAICLVVLGGCRSLLGIDDPIVGGDAASGDGGPDASLCLGPAPWTVCLRSAPTAPLVIKDGVIVDPCEETAANIPELCVLSGTDVMLQGTVRITGRLPVAIVATGQLTVAVGMIDAGGHLAEGGPGSDVPGCVAASAPVSGVNGGGGGAGGSLVTRGGNGGGGDSGQNAGANAGTVFTPSMLRGGCSGSRGVPGGSSSTADPGGAGGGGLYLIGGHDMMLDGTINAGGGGGGRGGASKGGGSGGGSGGMIVLWSPRTTGSVTLLANGGGGGGGADNGAPGAAGADSNTLGAAFGGTGGSAAVGRGGTGGVLSLGGNNGGNDGTGAGGGGGGGGVGKILILGAHDTLTVAASPAP